MKKSIKILITLILILIVAVGGIRLLKLRKSEVANLPTPELPVYVVKGSLAKKGTITEKVKFLGKIIPDNEIFVSTKFSGNIQKIYVEEGDRIRKGQLIAKIDDKPVRLSIENLKINKESLKNQLNSLKAELESAKSNYQFVKTNFERDEKLFKGKAISEIQFLQSKTQLDTAKAKIDVLQANIESLKNKITSIDKQIEIKKSDMKYLDIYSSTDGIVEKVLLKEGNLAVPGKPILKIQSVNYKILVNFPKDYLGLIKKETTAIIYFEKVKKVLKINNIYPSADKNSLAVAEIFINKLPKNTVSNSFVNVELITKKVEGVVVPKMAVLTLTNGTFIITQKDGRFIKIPVKVLAYNEENAVVQGNINEGIPVAVAEENKLRLLAMGKKGKILIQR